MKIKEWTKSFIHNVTGGISRFKTVFALSIIMFVALSADILWALPFEWVGELVIALPVGAFVSVLFTVLGEKTRFKKWIGDVVSVSAVIGCFVLTYIFDFSNAHFWMGYWGIIIASITFTVALLFDEGNKLVLIPHLVKSLLFSVLVGGILSAGISICLWAFYELIYDFDGDIFLVANLLIWLVGVVNLFLAYLPKKDDEIKLPKLFKVIAANVALPIYALLMAILYVYLAKIIITWNMPVGQINWFASFATLFFVFFLFCVRQYEDKFTKLFVKFAGWFVIPVVIMQLIAIYERVSAYGLTTPRTISLILVAVGIIFAVVSILGKKVEKVLWAVGIIVLLFTLTPKFNIIDMPVASQVGLLEEYLVKNDMLADGKITANAKIDEKDKERIRSAYNYLVRSEGKLPEWVDVVDTDQFKTVFGFERYDYDNEEWEHYSYGCDSAAGRLFDIASYSKMQFVEYDYSEEYPLFETNIDGVKYSFDMLKVFYELKEKYGDVDTIEPVALDENITLFFDYSYYNLIDSKVDGLYFKGFLFIK